MKEGKVEKYDIGYIKKTIYQEGFGWTVVYGILPDEIEDENLALLWRKAAKALKDIDDVLNCIL